MTNKEIYKRTLTFSLKKLMFDVISLVLFAAATVGGVLLAEKFFDQPVIGLIVGLIIGIIVAVIISRFAAYNCKAAQIAMMTRAITEGALPDDVYAEGKREVKGRFLTVAVYFAVTGAIKGIFMEIGRLITKVGDSIGGDTGSAVGSAISSAVNTLVAYLCDCCLGWVFYRRDISAGKATCEGAVLFFRHGKTLLKNMGRIFGMGIASFLVIGGAFGGGFYLLFSQFPALFSEGAKLFAESSDKLQFLSNPLALTIAAAVLAGAIVWSMIHSVFIRPFVLTGVLRNYIESGMNDVPTEASFGAVATKSAKFRKLQAEL